MLNIIVELEDGNLNPVMDCFGLNTRNYVIPRESSEAVIVRILQILAGKKHRKTARVILTATRCGETRFFDAAEICYFESFRNLVSIIAEKDSFEFYGTLYKVEEATKRLGFFRVSNSYIISLMHIRRIHRGYVVLNNGKAISIGRKYRSGFREAVRKSGAVRL